MFCPLSWEYWNGVKTTTRKCILYHFIIAFAVYVHYVVFL